MAEEKLPAYVGFKPTKKDINTINAIKSHFPVPEQLSNAQILRMALAVYLEDLSDNS